LRRSSSEQEIAGGSVEIAPDSPIGVAIGFEARGADDHAAKGDLVKYRLRRLAANQ